MHSVLAGKTVWSMSDSFETMYA